MGTIYYGGSALPIEIEDRALAHLKVVIAAKLRRGESFTVSWRHPDDQPRGRSTLWLHPSIPLRFVFDDPEPTVLSREWLRELANSANSSGGLTIVAEHFDTGATPIPEQASEQGEGDSAAAPETEPEALPPIETWWPELTIPVRHALLRDPRKPLGASVRRAIERLTGQPVAEGVELGESDLAFIRTQQEPVD